MQSRTEDPEKLSTGNSRSAKFINHTGHYDTPRWHYTLHPSVAKECARNALPAALGHVFHPTHATLTISEGGSKQKWFSRWHRKNLYKRPSDQLYYSFWIRLANMRHLEYWNVSWWVAVWFTLGSIVWVINGFAAFLPFTDSSFMKAPNSQGWTAFLGATIFELGSIFGILEAWNREDVTQFGWSVKQVLTPNPPNPNATERAESDNAAFQSQNEMTSNPVSTKQDDRPPEHSWIWFSTNRKYFRELGFLGAFFQLLAASIFWISGFTAVPNIQDGLMNNPGLNNGIFWTPQVIGGTGFMISATFIMLEAQKVWWKPNFTSLGWQVGVWNFIGAVGFTLSGAFGYAAMASSGAEFESALSTFWGGWAFLIGSVIQWYECVNSV